MEQPTCGWCRTPLNPPARKWCSDTCRAKFKYYRDIDASREAGRRRWRSEDFTPSPPFDCAHCGNRCVPGGNVGRRADKFCSPRCRKMWHKAENPDSYRATSATRKRALAKTRLTKAARGTSGNGRWAGHICSECGARFVARLNASDPRSRNVYCRFQCKNRYFARARRAQLRNVGMGDPVRRHEIAERDGYRCQLCRKPVKRDATVPHPKAPVLDHIIPLSKGGTHEPANVQLAHFMCNSIKSDNIGGAGDQLRLIG